MTFNHYYKGSSPLDLKKKVHSLKTKRLLRQLGLKSIRSDDTKLKIAINNSRSKTFVITNIESGSKGEFPSIVKA